MSAEEKKKRKLVVEETSLAEPVVEAEIPGETEVQDKNKIDPSLIDDSNLQEETEEKPIVLKHEAPKKSLLIPIEEKESENSSESVAQDSKVSIFWVILLALFIIASLIGGGILVFKAGVEKGKLETGGSAETVPSPTASAVPSASPSIEVKREDLKIQVLNGTGKAGVAATAETYLEGLGYKNMETGNADTSNFTETVISIKDSKKDYTETLKSDLSKKYAVSVSTKTLSSTSDFDAVVTIGTSIK